MSGILHSIIYHRGQKLSSDSDRPLLTPNCSTQSAISTYHVIPPHVNTFQVEPSTLDGLVTPYPHQVGGHAPLLALGQRHICKPFHEVEYAFYTNTPECLKEFTPSLCLEAELSFDIRCSEVLVKVGSTSRSANFQPCHYCTDGESKENVPSTVRGDAGDDVLFRDVSSGLASPLNPWAFHCQMKCFGQKTPKTLDRVGRYLIFENLTANFRYPCILDLKLGTRQHSDIATSEKKWHQQWKCLKTTSNEMGLRVCGMQYYEASSATYQCMDKYAGRQLGKKGVRKLLRRFFTDSHYYNDRIRLDVCSQVLDRLRRLSKVMEKLDSYRFFGASLLVIYEGDNSAKCYGNKDRVKVKLIDFANITMPSGSQAGIETNHLYSGPDKGCLLGLETLESILVQCVG